LTMYICIIFTSTYSKSMKFTYILSIIFFLAVSFDAYSQARSENGYYLVEMEQFTPPVQDLIKSYEGFPATPFMANDMNGTEQFLGDFKGKPLVLFFWSTTNSDAVSMLYELNNIKKKYGKKVNIIAMADESREDITKFLGDDKMSLVVIPNSRMLSEAVYGVELGYPRIFMIDDTGVIRSVIPEQFFDTNGNHTEILNGAIKSMVKA